MTEWRWCEVFPPRGMALPATTAAMRVLAGRPRMGALGLQPMVVFELWLYRDRPRWLIGMDERIANHLPGEFRAQCPGLTLVEVEQPERPRPVTGRELRLRSLTYPVRLDTAEGVTAALLRIRDDLHTDEAVVVQFVVGPARLFAAYPQRQTPLDILGFTTPPEPDAADRQAWRHKLASRCWVCEAASARWPLTHDGRRSSCAQWEISILKSQVRWLAWGRFGVIGLVDRWFGSS